ncbi:MAG: hypothetical protein NE328_03285, partial [Lentisphaeraceae bacterium]|nr:hypothetical protein [Lentisphaeraceae bacterium]
IKFLSVLKVQSSTRNTAYLRHAYFIKIRPWTEVHVYLKPKLFELNSMTLAARYCGDPRLSRYA